MKQSSLLGIRALYLSRNATWVIMDLIRIHMIDPYQKPIIPWCTPVAIGYIKGEKRENKIKKNVAE